MNDQKTADMTMEEVTALLSNKNSEEDEFVKIRVMEQKPFTSKCSKPVQKRLEQKRDEKRVE